MHGEQKHLRKNAGLAKSVGIPPQNILIADNGKEVELTEDKIRISGDVPAGMVFVDGSGVGDVGSVVLRDRKRLAEDGLIIIVATIDKETGDVLSGPEVISRGFVYVRESEQLIDKARRLCDSVIADCMFERVHDWTTVKKSPSRRSLSPYVPRDQAQSYDTSRYNGNITVFYLLFTECRGSSGFNS